ncbi:MAG TPA: hypothetical protein VII95_20395 [Terriglobales bacterium]|jgi:hypothetical protein
MGHPNGLRTFATHKERVWSEPESTVVEVAPSYENDKIREMEAFGWNLQGRQEIHQEGDAYGRPSYLDSSTYVVKVKVSHYVKLHFVRGLSLPNLDTVRQLELEYNNLPFPPPAPIGWPLGIAVFFSIGVIGVIIGKIPVLALPVYVVFGGLGALWLTSRLKKRGAGSERRALSMSRAKEILDEAQRLEP